MVGLLDIWWYNKLISNDDNELGDIILLSIVFLISKQIMVKDSWLFS